MGYISELRKYIGHNPLISAGANALHPYQDIYAHGYISYNNFVSASHGVNQDKQDYVWKDTSDRGRSVLAGDAVKKGTGSKPRITETKNKSVSVIKIVNGW